MKRFTSFLTVLMACMAVTPLFGQNLVLSPEQPMPGEAISITYDPTGTPLDGYDFDAVAYVFHDNKPVAYELKMEENDDKFTGSFAIPQEASALLFGFSNQKEDKTDNNNKKGYKKVLAKSDRSTPVEGGYAHKAMIVGQYGWLVDLDRDYAKALRLLMKEFELYPASKDNLDYQGMFAQAAKQSSNNEALASSEALMEKIMADGNATEEEMMAAHSMLAYTFEKDEADQKAYWAKILEKYPNGSAAMRDLYQEFRKASEVADQVTLYGKMQGFKDVKGAENNLNYMASSIAGKYAKAEDWDNYKKYLKLMTDNSRMAGALNSAAWPMSGESLDGEPKNPEMGLQLSGWSLELIEQEMKNPSNKPDYMTDKAWKRNMKFSYGMYADTYALLAYHLDKHEDALKYQQISCDANEFGDGEMNQRYCAYYEKVKGGQAAEKVLADLIADGKGSSKMKEQHKRLFMANNTMESAYDKYVVQLEKAALEKMKEDLKKKMIDMPAPSFVLKNLDGETVSLESLKGKVVVVDFWATWCGPCKASFPGMQKAVNKFQKSNDVEFVFVDTWESGDDKQTKVQKFITDHEYTFNVLMDNESEVVKEFGVSGIPTKYVVDKDGNIRFKSVGFGGNDEELVNELTMMIEMAGGTIPVALQGAP